jgi:hypothetical protein
MALKERRTKLRAEAVVLYGRCPLISTLSINFTALISYLYPFTYKPHPPLHLSNRAHAHLEKLREFWGILGLLRGSVAVQPPPIRFPPQSPIPTYMPHNAPAPYLSRKRLRSLKPF